MLADQKIEMKWNNANRKHYEEKGYVFTHNGDSFYVDIKDLSCGSSVNLKIICDCCGKEYQMTYGGYLKGYEKSIKNNIQLKHFCDECKFKKRQENLYIKSLQSCEKKGYFLLSDKSEILCNTSYVRYLCPLHGEHKMRVSNLISGKGCPDCVGLNNSERFRLSYDEV